MQGEEPSMKQSKKNKLKKIEKDLDSVVTFTIGASEKSVEKKKKKKKKKKTKNKNKEGGAVNVEEDNCEVEVEPELKNVDDEEKNKDEEGNNEKADVNSSLQEEPKLEKQLKKKKSKKKANENDVLKPEEVMRADFKDLNPCETSENNIEKKKKQKLKSEVANDVKVDNYEKGVESELRDSKRNSKKKVKDEGHEKDGTSSSFLEESTGAHKNHKKKGNEKVIDKSPSPQTEEKVTGEEDALTKECQTSGFSKKKRKRKAVSGGSEDVVQSEKKKGKKNDKNHEGGLKSSSRIADGTSADKANGKASSSKNETSGDTSEGPVSKKKARRVSFSSDVEVFPPHYNSDVKAYNENNLVRGRRFSAEEDQLIRDAVYKYIERNQLGEEGLKMVLNRNPEVRHCWQEIGMALPWRPVRSVSSRAHILFERSEKRGFTEEECEIIRKFRAEHGPQWKKFADILGKHRTHLRDKWRRTRLRNVKTGQWSQKEYQILFDLVNLDLRMRAFEKASSSHVMIRENISWEAISDRLTTRTMSACCQKWYFQLTSPLVREGLWADTDDYWLLCALYKQDSCNIEDVEWDYLLPHRSGEVCWKRWEEMARHLGGYRERSFVEQVDVLSKRYCADMLQYRKDSKEDGR